MSKASPVQEACPSSTVIIAGCDSGVVDPGTFNDLIQQAVDNAKNHGDFVSSVAKLTKQWKKDRLITEADKEAIMACAT